MSESDNARFECIIRCEDEIGSIKAEMDDIKNEIARLESKYLQLEVVIGILEPLNYDLKAIHNYHQTEASQIEEEKS